MDDQDFEQLYWTLQPKLLAYALGLLDEAAAYDVVAATFETLLRKRIQETEPQEWIGLAFTVLRRHVSHEYRAQGRRNSLRQRVAREPHTVQDTDVAERIAQAAQVRQWLARLSESDREVIALFNAGYSTAEIAQALRCSPVAAARRRDRAKKRLRAIVEAELAKEVRDDPTFA